MDDATVTLIAPRGRGRALRLEPPAGRRGRPRRPLAFYAIGVLSLEASLAGFGDTGSATTGAGLPFVGLFFLVAVFLVPVIWSF